MHPMAVCPSLPVLPEVAHVPDRFTGIGFDMARSPIDHAHMQRSVHHFRAWSRTWVVACALAWFGVDTACSSPGANAPREAQGHTPIPLTEAHERFAEAASLCAADHGATWSPS